MAEPRDPGQLIAAALAEPFTGWDFSFLRGRTSVTPLPWHYPAEVAALAGQAGSMLDMGTGGGEVLSRLARPQRTAATEAWPPNVPVAAGRLRPLGIAVVQCEGAPRNMEPDGTKGRLPFAAAAFGIVTNRHESFTAREVARVLRPGGWFLTQQVDLHTYDDFYAALELPRPGGPASWLPLARDQVTAAGLTVSRAEAGEEVHRFHDVGALAYYLRVLSRMEGVPDPAAHGAALRRLHDRLAGRPVAIRQRRFLLAARKA